MHVIVPHDHLSCSTDRVVMRYGPRTNILSQVTCETCLVIIDRELEIGRAIVRPITNIVVFNTDEDEHLSAEAFIRAAMVGDIDHLYTRDDIEQIHINSGFAKEDIVRKLKEAGFKAIPLSTKEKAEYKFNSGGTFGFNGLR